ncbi:M14 family metallopeptidase [Inmirania thermothiophila]|uniref:Succinylglutamate desuccinylase/aspartoacylase family protein n=1 Tax=Inmirania thermothiophila TaxID=1750597 RepID=A0A3N1Y779_9GAMM|nr:M14 family metallopeptidase [Inmirania thermothiophila]ROR34676.1 succinylglutamate desuccinylase/aspartoacylase family protein [Inmirania thermothiophila]
MLRVLEGLPEGFLAADARTLHRVLPGPALIHLRGRREPPLFVSLLLHGNEPVGLEAVQRLLAAGRELPRALTLFVGNVEAARAGVRRLPGQPDYNRVWPGSELPPAPEHAMMAEVVARMRERGVFASVDLHNNTGLNPHYACVNRLEPAFLHLAVLFSRTVVWFLRPRGVQSAAFAPLCPSVTLECGRVGEARGAAHACAFLEACLRMDHLPAHPVPGHDIDLFHTVAVVRVAEGVPLGLGRGGPGLRLAPDLDRLNFRELPPGTVLGWVEGCGARCLEVHDEAGRDVARRYFEVTDGALRTRVPLMPSMLTLDTEVVRQDCLCYLMERVPAAAAGGAVAAAG